MKISAFEKKVGLTRDTIRYYEKIGLLTPPLRSENGYRYYSETQIQELDFIQKGKAIGFTLGAIKEGYRRFKMLGKLCPEFVSELEEKKCMFQARIKEDKQALKEIEKMLRKSD